MTAAIAVCGFGRCGSTMLMTMLHAGGIQPAGGAVPHSYELAGIDVALGLTAGDLAGRSVKLLDSVLYRPLPDADGWRIVWLDRDPRHQARSHLKMLRAAGLQQHAGMARDLADSYRRDRPLALAALRGYGPVHEATYEDAVRNPDRFASVLAEFLAPDLTLDADAAAAAVHRRRPYCAPDLSFEMTGTANGGGSDG